ncbi:MAG: putative DNA binding domain-containing protein [Planctomycetaceae bacterium]|jgi:ATP-dependent DNA helicase RecG|nr:putative DNA binding domain-containing protein [Planctomycetaceae bacterium]
MKNTILKNLLEAVEGEKYEFKEAKERFDVDELTRYACAFANTGGGKIILGVTDKRPRQIVGTNAFVQPERICSTLIERLCLRIELQIFEEGGKRVLVFSIPARPIGVPIRFKGHYWTRLGDSLLTMHEDELRDIFAESGHDFSADPCVRAKKSDLDSKAIEDFRRRWVTKSGNQRLESLTSEQLLRDCEAITSEGITYAALILFGTHEALGRLLGQSEIIFEYRSSEASGPAQFRQEFRQGFFTYYDQLWELVNSRNDLQHFQDGLFVFDVPTFEERTVREAILNAVCHRNYQHSGSIFIRQYQRKLVVESPGGLPPDVTIKNILECQTPRNRRIADIFSKCGLVERSGQGMNLIFEWSIKQAKMLPDLSKTDKNRVILQLDGVVRDPQLLIMMEKIGKETLETFNTNDFLIVNYVQQEKTIPKIFRDRIPRLIDRGILERVGRGKFILSQRYYDYIDQKGTYTRKRGLNRGEQKTLLLKHIQSSREEGCPLRELCQVLPECTENQIRVLLRELRKEEKIMPVGTTRAGRWFVSHSTQETKTPKKE